MRFWWWRVEAEQDMTEEAEVAREESLPTPSRSRLAPTIPWLWELVGRRQSTHLVMAFLEQIHSLVGLQPLAVRAAIAAMPW